MTQSSDLHRRLYVGTVDGVCALSSYDAGRTWEQGNMTPLDHAAARLSVSASEPGVVYLAAYEAGVLRSDDSGATWRQLPSYPTGYAHSVTAHPDQPGVVFVGSEPAAIFRSNDGGENWEESESFRQVPESSRWNFHGDRLSHVRELRMAPGDPDTMFAGIEVGGMVRSDDGGESWKQLEGTHDDIHFVNVSRGQPGTGVRGHGRSAVSQRRWRGALGKDQRWAGTALHFAHHRGSHGCRPSAGDGFQQRRAQQSSVLPLDGRRPPLEAG